jgi:hypothetical protein
MRFAVFDHNDSSGRPPATELAEISGIERRPLLAVIGVREPPSYQF